MVEGSEGHLTPDLPQPIHEGGFRATVKALMNILGGSQRNPGKDPKVAVTEQPTNKDPKVAIRPGPGLGNPIADPTHNHSR